jgi:hypothetical protein
MGGIRNYDNVEKVISSRKRRGGCRQRFAQSFAVKWFHQ